MNDLIVLAILLDGPQHGYALKKRAGLVMANRELHNNIIYPMLERFIENGWVHRKQQGGERGQTRQVYSLTATGKRALLERLSAFDEKQAHSENEFHLRVGLFQLLSPESRNRILEIRGRVLHQRDEHLELLQASERLADYNAEVVAFRRGQIASELKWVRKLSRLKFRSKR